MLNHLTGFFDRLLGSACQIAHFIGHYGETASGFTCPCRFNRGIEGKQVGLFRNCPNDLKDRANFLAIGGQPLDLCHGHAHVGGQQINAGGGAINDGEALASCLIGIASGLGRLSSAARDILRRCAHFMGRRGGLIDLAVLLLHASTGLSGNGRRLIRCVTGILYRTLDLGDDRLQFVEKPVEPASQLPQFVFFIVGQAPSQIALTTGNVFEHVGHVEDWPRDAAGHQPYQQQTYDRSQNTQAQLRQGTCAVALVQLCLQSLCRADQHLLRHIEQNAPGLAARDREKRCQHFQP